MQEEGAMFGNPGKHHSVPKLQLQLKLHGLSPRANYTGRATAACRRLPTFDSVPKRITNSDDFDKSLPRRTVYNFYTQEATVPSTRKLLPKLRETINFKGGSTSLKLILRKVEFKWKETP
jgi:hypothetical protein